MPTDSETKPPYARHRPIRLAQAKKLIRGVRVGDEFRQWVPPKVWRNMRYCYVQRVVVP